ncbi:MAG: cell wall-binding repeat-containing protein [Candidatus Limnocylindrales bacterium]
MHEPLTTRFEARPRPSVALIALAAIVALVASLLASLAPVVAPPVHAAASLKAVLIVGADSSGYKSDADGVAATFVARGVSVTKLYTPGATWPNVKAAMQGANFVVYMGHGNGYPNPYPPGYLMPDRVDGFVLDKSGASGCASSSWTYCGESPIGSQVALAPNAIVLLEHLCYASGDSEPGNGQPSLSVAMQRVDNYATGFLRAGAAAVFAFGMQNVGSVVNTIFDQPDLTMDEVFTSLGDGGGDQVIFGSSRTPGTGAHMDPRNSPTSEGQTYYRSVAGHLEVTGTQVLGGSAPGPDPDRWAGADRYATAAAISAHNFSPGVPVAYVATGATFPDALAGAAAAHHAGGPVLLTAAGSLPAATKVELERLNPGKIVVLGGSDAVSDVVFQALQSGGYTAGSVTRVGGADRYATAALISATTFSPGPGPVNVSVAYIATGANFPDALVGAAAAGKDDAPLLLTTATALPQPIKDELLRLKPKRIVILGSTGVISQAVATALDAYTSGSITRLAGADRYATAAAISAASFPVGVSTAYVATGANVPDALAGAALGRPLLLVPGAWVPSTIETEAARLSPSRVVVLGGIYTVSLTSESELKTAAGLP